MKKKLFTRSLSFALILCAVLVQLAIPVGATVYTPIHQQKAETLSTLGLLLGGTGGDFMLDKGLKRSDMSIMLVRLLGKVSEATSGAYSHPFEDVRTATSWASDYVGFLYQNGMIAGKTSTHYGAVDPTTYTQFIAVTLRSLGYTEAAGDFAYNDAPVKAVEVGLLTSAELSMIKSSEALQRDNMVLIAYNALFTRMKGTTRVLLDSLSSVSDTALTQAAATDTKVAFYLSGGMSSGMTASEISAAVSPSVGLIDVFNAAGNNIGSGSGFIVSSSGIMVTCYHVIEGASSAKVHFPDGKSYAVSSVLGYNVDSDIAVLQLLNASSLPALKVGDSSSVKNGDKIYTVSYPLGLSLSVSEGIVGSSGYTVANQSYIQFSAPVSQGSSGGAVVNTSGQVVGIVVGALSAGQSLNLAIPINSYKSLPQNKNMTLQQVAAAEGVTVPDLSWITEAEPNNSIASAQSLSLNDEKPVFGSLSGSSDADYYSFTTGGGEFFGLFMLDPSQTSKLTGVRFQLLSSSGTVISTAVSTYYGGSFYLVLYPEALLPAGTYYIAITYSGPSFSGEVEYAFSIMVD